jgi:hypothetical protein
MRQLVNKRKVPLSRRETALLASSDWEAYEGMKWKDAFVDAMTQIDFIRRDYGDEVANQMIDKYQLTAKFGIPPTVSKR